MLFTVNDLPDPGGPKTAMARGLLSWAVFSRYEVSSLFIARRLLISDSEIVLIFPMFALSDAKEYAQRHVSVVLVSWVDSAEIASLVEEISI